MMLNSFRQRAMIALAAVTVLALPTIATALPKVFQASGPAQASIQSSVDHFRVTLGNPNNGNAPGPLPSGRREINWDGGGGATTLSPTPFTGFQVIRGAVFNTPGTGFVQAPQSGLADTFMNPTYSTIFTTFSSPRLFAAIGSNITDVNFTIPGAPAIPATVSGFGAIFTDVDLPDSTRVEFYDADDNLLHSSYVLASPGDGDLSFLGVFFTDGERVARVRIISGNSPLGPEDGGSVDVVAMDDFLYGEPQPSVMAR